jgi:hypothetical protein
MFEKKLFSGSPPRGGGWRKVIILAITVVLIFFFLTSMDNFSFVWNPKDWVTEAVYLANWRPARVPKETPAPTKEVAALVDQGLIPAFYLIQQDSEFSYLAQYAIINKINISVSDESATEYCQDDDACYDNIATRCSKKNSPGTIYFKSKAVANYSTSFLAGVLVHELTHAQNHLEKPAYYCLGQSQKYLSDEFLAFKNQDYFEKKYEWVPVADYFDRQGNLHQYCLYSRVKETYAKHNLIDDVNLQPPSRVENFFCLLH